MVANSLIVDFIVKYHYSNRMIQHYTSNPIQAYTGKVEHPIVSITYVLRGDQHISKSDACYIVVLNHEINTRSYLVIFCNFSFFEGGKTIASQ